MKIGTEQQLADEDIIQGNKEHSEEDVKNNATEAAKNLEKKLKNRGKLNNAADILSEAFVNREIQRFIAFFDAIDVKDRFNNNPQYKAAMKAALIYYYMDFFRSHPNVLQTIQNSGILKAHHAAADISAKVYMDSYWKTQRVYTEASLEAARNFTKSAMTDFGLPLYQGGVLNMRDSKYEALPNDTYLLLLLATAQFGLTPIREDGEQQIHRKAGTLTNLPKGGFLAPENKIYDFLSNIYDKPLYDSNREAVAEQLISVVAPHGAGASLKEKVKAPRALFKSIINDFNKKQAHGKDDLVALYLQDLIKEIALIHYDHHGNQQITSACNALMLELTRYMLSIANGKDLENTVELCKQHITTHQQIPLQRFSTYTPSFSALVKSKVVEKKEQTKGSSQSDFFRNKKEEQSQQAAKKEKERAATDAVLAVQGIVALDNAIKANPLPDMWIVAEAQNRQTQSIITTLKQVLDNAAKEPTDNQALQCIEAIFTAIYGLTLDKATNFAAYRVTKKEHSHLIEACETAAQQWLFGFSGIPLEKEKQKQYHCYTKRGYNQSVINHNHILDFEKIRSLLANYRAASPALFGSKAFKQAVSYLENTAFPQLTSTEDHEDDKKCSIM